MAPPDRGRQRIARYAIRRSIIGLFLLLSLVVTSAATGLRGPRHGGTIMVTWGGTLATLDPAYTYSYVDWPQTHAVFDGLLGFGSGTNLVPHLAASMPTLSSDRKTYTFHLRHGLVFSNGDPLTAEDFVFSWERELAAKSASPDVYFWFALKGQADFTAGKTKHISGLNVLDPYTLQITLTEPYAAFLYVLAVPCSMVVDPAVVHKYHAENKDLGVHVVGSGPFMLKDWVPGQKLDLVRNPHYSGPSPAYVDGVHYDLGVDPSVALLRLEKGQIDLFGDPIPSAEFASVVNDPKLSKLLVHRTDVGVYMIALNTHVKPFNNVLVRRAIGYAINKTRAVRFINGRGVAATGFLPPTLPDWGQNIPDPYPYNPDKAKQLLAQAGYPHGFNTTMGVPSLDYEHRMADAAIYDLKQIGINVAVKPVQAEGTAIPNLPMIAYHWLMDYPDPADFVDGFTSCSGAVNGGSNVAYYCNHTVDDLANSARTMPPGPARNAAYKHIDELVMADEPSVPVFYDVFYELHSARLQNFTIHPIWYPFALEQYWLSS